MVFEVELQTVRQGYSPFDSTLHTVIRLSPLFPFS